MLQADMAMSSIYDVRLVALSIVIAVLASYTALDLAGRVKTRKWLRIGSALIMGAAISGMQYTGMAAANFKPTQNVAAFASQSTNTSFTWLAAAIGIATLILLGFALMTSFVDQRLTAQAKLIEQQEVEQARVQLFSTLTLRIRDSLNYDEILETAVGEIRKALFTDRVVIYRFDSDWRGTVVAESVVPGWTQALNEQIEDPCFKEHHIEKYEAGRVLAIDNIYQAGENIQLETSAVVQAMELGTTQVVEGAYLVKDAKHSLGQILEVSRQIDELVQSISHATVSQAKTSQAVAILMKQIAQASERTSDSSHQVSSSLLQTVEVAQQLQASVGVFKIGA